MSLRIPVPDEFKSNNGDGFRFYTMLMDLKLSADPLSDFQNKVENMLHRMDDAEDDLLSPGEVVPCPAEQFLAIELLEENIALAHMPQAELIETPNSGLIFIRPYETPKKHIQNLIISIESCLNLLIMADDHFMEPLEEITLEQLYEYRESLLLDPITREFPRTHLLGETGTPFDPDEAKDEWTTRINMSYLIESIRLPYRFEAQFRLNLKEGCMALEINLPPRNAFPKNTFLKPVEKKVSLSPEDTTELWSLYALKLGLMGVALGFYSSELVTKMYVTCNSTDNDKKTCYYSCEVNRDMFSPYLHKSQGDALAFAQAAGATFSFEDRALHEVKKGFDLNDPLFCPPERYEDIEHSKRLIPEDEAEFLGAKSVHDLACDPHAAMNTFCNQLSEHLGDTAKQDVSAIFEAIQTENDPSVIENAERTIMRIIEGKIDYASPENVIKDIRDYSPLARPVALATKALADDRNGKALEILRDALLEYEKTHDFTDTDEVVYRALRSPVERAMYNVLSDGDHPVILPVDENYYSALLLMISALSFENYHEEAKECALRATTLNPFDERAALRLARCYEMLGDIETTQMVLSDLLKLAYTQEMLGTAYYRMAGVALHNDDTKLAIACYQKAQTYDSSVRTMATIELDMMTSGSKRLLKTAALLDIDKTLEEAGIQVGVSEFVLGSLVDIAAASINSGLFEVAREALELRHSIAADDILYGVWLSLGEKPKGTQSDTAEEAEKDEQKNEEGSQEDEAPSEE